MKRVISVLFCLFCLSVSASDWILHGAIGTNPFPAFSRVNDQGTAIEVIDFAYGVDPTWTFDWDGWMVENVPYTSGPVLILEESWKCLEIPWNDNYGTASAMEWGIEDSAPNFTGWGQMPGPAVPGEYWLDFSSTGEMRASTSKPIDFGKWLSDGSINAYWVEPPLAPVERTKRGRGHNK